MQREKIIPSDKQEWLALKAITGTSTEAAALFNLSPYLTYYEMWHRKKEAAIVEIEASNLMKLGTALEDAIATHAASESLWKTRKMKEFITIPSERIGSSFDHCILDDDGNDQAILEIKNVNNIAFKQGWLIDDSGEIEAPVHIELQVQQQMQVSGIHKCYIAALVGGYDLKILYREYDEDIGKKISDAWKKFWQSIDEKKAPDPDFERDADYIQSLHKSVINGTTLDARGNDHINALIFKYKDSAATAKKAEELKQAAKAELLTMIGAHEKVFGDGWKISAGMIKGGPVQYIREPYRDFRIFTNNKG